MSIVDAHHHVWDLAVRDQPWLAGPAMAPIRRSFRVDDLRPSAQAAAVTATVLVQTVTVAEETPELLAVAAADPLVVGVVGWTDLTSPAISAELARLAAGPGGRHLVGIRHQVQSEPDRDWLRRPDVLRGLRAVAAAAYAADEVPGLTLILDHAGKPPIGGELADWRADIRAFAARPNTACKLSGLVTEASAGAPADAFAPVADVILEEFGPERIMFGSDWPVCLLARDYAGVVELAHVLTAGWSDTERTAVFSSTAARLYGIGVPRPGADGNQTAGDGSWR